jgi:hypothetical protein
MGELNTEFYEPHGPEIQCPHCLQWAVGGRLLTEAGWVQRYALIHICQHCQESWWEQRFPDSPAAPAERVWCVEEGQ